MKTKFTIYKLHFTAPLHLGDERDDYSVSLKTFQSDAMYAALTASLAKLGVEIPPGGYLGFNISSLFPFYQKSDKDRAIYFFPKPLKQKLPDLKDVKNAKKVKKVAWFDKDNFEKLIHGQNLFNDETVISTLDGEFLSSQEFDPKFISSQVSPRVTVSRNQKEDAKPFYMDRIYFRDYSGLFFLVECDDTSLLDKAMNLLEHEGIGTDRNIGNGFFKFDTDHIELDLPESNNMMSLSMFWPVNSDQLKELMDGDVAYDFQKRGGWISTSPYNTFRKNTVHMFMPGSVFVKPNDLTNPIMMGNIGDLKPKSLDGAIKHPIYRSGKSLFIPIKI